MLFCLFVLHKMLKRRSLSTFVRVVLENMPHYASLMLLALVTTSDCGLLFSVAWSLSSRVFILVCCKIPVFSRNLMEKSMPELPVSLNSFGSMVHFTEKLCHFFTVHCLFQLSFLLSGNLLFLLEKWVCSKCTQFPSFSWRSTPLFL